VLWQLIHWASGGQKGMTGVMINRVFDVILCIALAQVIIVEKIIPWHQFPCELG
jgi:hypothetical protein